MLNIKKEDGIEIVKFDGVSRFNSDISQDVKNALSPILDLEGTKMIISLEGIKFIDSSAFGTLISLIKVCKKSNSLFKLCNASNEVIELITIMQLDTVFEVFSNIESCKKSF